MHQCMPLSNTGSVPDADIIAAIAKCLNTDSVLAKMHVINVLVCSVKMAEIAGVGVIYYARLWFSLCTVSSLNCTDSSLNVLYSGKYLRGKRLTETQTSAYWRV